MPYPPIHSREFWIPVALVIIAAGVWHLVRVAMGWE
jgi:uncharacterized membrane protein